MNTRLLGESIKNGIGFEIVKNFPGVLFYKEQITRPIFPHFFVLQLTLSAQEERKDYWWLNYLMTLRYREADNIALVPDLQARLDGVGLQLMHDLTDIKIAGFPLRITNPRYEKQEGVLHYFCNVNFQVTKEAEEQIKMWNQEIAIKLKEKGVY